MIVSEVRVFLKQMNESNALILVNFVLENTHKYHENYSINIQKFEYEFVLKEIFFFYIIQLKSQKGFSKPLKKMLTGLVFSEYSPGNY
jgi:hypothetical protein